MSRNCWRGWSVVGLMVGSLATAGPLAAEEVPSPPQAAEFVEQALSAALSGQQEVRAEMLQRAIDRDPDCAPANWLLGHAQYQDAWLPLRETAALAKSDPVLREYQQRCRASSPTADDHWKLALWCKREGLIVEREAQLYAVLRYNPNHAQARAALGYVRVGHGWYTPAELKAARADALAAQAAFHKWRPRLTSIAKRLLAANTASAAAAQGELNELTDIEAIGCLEQELSAVDPRLADRVLEVLDRMPAREASVSLARHAVFAPWPQVRADATEMLRARPKYDYLPLLITSLSTNWQSQVESRGNDGGLWHRNVQFREGFDRQYVNVLTSQINIAATVTPNNPRRGLQLAHDSLAVAVNSQEAWMNAENERIDMVNDRVTAVLAQVTGEELGSEPEPWWDYWNSQIDYHQPSKPVETTTEHYERTVSIPRTSCFVAGTPVWTSTGPRAIERIQVGDCVAAQDVVTGELRFRPVVLTTVRPPRELVRLTIEEEEITSTPGHLYWVVGHGWRPARELRPGDRVSGASTTREVRGTATAGAVPTYNLVVADAHTYFVGQEPLLVHDNTQPSRERQSLPGMPIER